MTNKILFIGLPLNDIDFQKIINNNSQMPADLIKTKLAAAKVSDIIYPENSIIEFDKNTIYKVDYSKNFRRF